MWVVQTNTAASAAAAALPRARISAGRIGRRFERGLFGLCNFSPGGLCCGDCAGGRRHPSFSAALGSGVQGFDELGGVGVGASGLAVGRRGEVARGVAGNCGLEWIGACHGRHHPGLAAASARRHRSASSSRMAANRSVISSRSAPHPPSCCMRIPLSRKARR